MSEDDAVSQSDIDEVCGDLREALTKCLGEPTSLRYKAVRRAIERADFLLDDIYEGAD